MSDAYSDDLTPVRSPAEPLLPAAITRAAGAAVFLALVLGMAVWAYRLGTRDATEVPVIRAMEGPARLQPDDPGGLQAAHQGLAVNDVLAGGPAPASAPEPAEAPAVLPPPVALTEEDGPQGELVLAVPDFPAVEPGEGEDLRLPVPDEGPAADAAATEAAPTDLASLVPALLAEAMATADAEAGEAEDSTAATTRPLGRPSGLVVRPETPRPVATAAPAPAAAPTASEASVAARPASGGAEVSAVAPGARLVQLGAFDNEALARQVWSQLVARNGDLLGGKSLYLERATHNARVFYRLRVAGFASTDETRVLCESLRGRGVDCIPVILN